MAVTVVVRGAGEQERLIALDAPRLVIGRGEGCDVRIPDPSVSLRHASLRQRGNEYVLVDEGSSNGTFIGQSSLPPHTQLAIPNGSLVRVGRVWLEIRIGAANVPRSTAAAAKELALTLVADGLRAQGEAPEPALRVIEGPDKGLELCLDETGREYVIGRAAEAEMRLTDTAAGRRHASVLVKGDAILVRDLSGRGVFVDDAQGVTEALVRAGQTVTIGADRMVFSYPAVEALQEIERGPDERLRTNDVPAMPTRPGDEPELSAEPPPVDAGKDPTPPPFGVSEPTPTPPPISPRSQGAWGFADAAVAFVAMGVIAVSAAGAWWLFH
jgi:pSer/pThr/pTyr-binding forkhead associated (FHA) protein